MASGSATGRPSQVRSHGMALLLILLLSWLLLGALWGQHGLPNTADGILHLHRSAAVARSWSAGVIWPRWLPEVYQGLGAPVFHYYSPLFYVAVAPLHLLGLPLDSAAKVVITISLVLSGLATWGWLKRLLGPASALGGAAVYISQPLLFREYYFQGDYPQLLALLWLPVVFWAFTRLCLDRRWSDWLTAPLSLALLVLAHNITAMLGIGMLVLYWIALVLWRCTRRGWWWGPLGAAFAAGLSAFFWLPALTDVGSVRISNLREGFFHFAQYFVPWQELIAAPPLFDSRAANPPFPHMVGWAAWLAVVGAVVAVIISFVRPRGWTRTRHWGLVGLAFVAIAVGFTQSWSDAIWDWSALLALVEFPGRWLGPAALGASLAGAAAISALDERWTWLGTGVLLLAVGLSSSVFLFPHQPFLPISDYTQANTQTFERRSGAWGTTSGNEFLPRWAGAPQPFASEQAGALSLPEGADWSWHTPHRAVLGTVPPMSLPAGGQVLPVHFFPAWRAVADGEDRPLKPSDDGLVEVELREGSQELVLCWAGTAGQKAGQWITLATLLVWAAWCTYQFRLRKRGDVSEASLPGQWSRGWLAVLGLVVVLVLARDLILLGDLDWFRRASPPEAVSHVAHPLQVHVGGGEQPEVTLLGWEFLSAGPKPGGQLRLRLYWQAETRVKEDLSSFASLYAPAVKRAWAGVQNENPGRIATSSWRRGLYYVDDLVLDVPFDIPPGNYTVAAGMVDAGGQRLTVQDNADGLIFLEAVSVEPLRADRARRQQPDVDTPVLVGEDLRLAGYDLFDDPGGPVLRLYWDVDQTPQEDLVVFVHMLDGEGALVAQFDAPPLEGMLPTSLWPMGSRMVDRHKLWIAPELGGRSYRLLVGLYDPVTGRRLVLTPEEGAEAYVHPDDAVVIPIDVPPAP